MQMLDLHLYSDEDEDGGREHAAAIFYLRDFELRKLAAGVVTEHMKKGFKAALKAYDEKLGMGSKSGATNRISP